MMARVTDTERVVTRPDPSGASTVGARKPRSGAIDVVRVLGIVAVVAGHTLPFPIVRTLLYSWHVPLFFVLAGYFWSPSRSLTQELTTRTRTLLRPMVTWSVLIGVVFVVVDLQFESSTWQRLAGPLTDGENSAMPFTTFWFVTALFFSAVFLRLLWRLPRMVVWAVAGVGLVLSFTVGPLLAATPLSVGSAVPCVAFLALGIVAKRLRPRVTRPGLLGGGLLAVSAALVLSGVALPLDIKQGDYGTPVLSALVAVAISFGLVLTAEWLCERLPESVGRIATVLACGGFAVVLAHPVILWAMTRFGPPVPDWMLFALCLLIPWAVALGALRTRASAWLTGSEPLRA
ncbi:acyltransferase family protein [Leifsonia shinshuensis]|uniref:Acyltransferase family protein n=1 Tax=Leifsonia shinshuensis TaxID=150026 RepID=A0A7G6YD52_9MICO|nr:acyltransferase family protein [Leifsonia shinshuensis]